jgi:hypothetical protein
MNRRDDIKRIGEEEPLCTSARALWLWSFLFPCHGRGGRRNMPFPQRNRLPAEVLPKSCDDSWRLRGRRAATLGPERRWCLRRIWGRHSWDSRGGCRVKGSVRNALLFWKHNKMAAFWEIVRPVYRCGLKTRGEKSLKKSTRLSGILHFWADHQKAYPNKPLVSWVVSTCAA